MTVRRLIAVLIVAGIAVGGTWACGGDSTSPSSVAGTYNLQTIDGQSLPFVIFQDGADKNEVMSGFERLNSDGTFSQSMTFRLTEGGQVSTETETADGSWRQSESAITLTYGGSVGTLTGSLSGNTLTLVEQGLVLVFRK